MILTMTFQNSQVDMTLVVHFRQYHKPFSAKPHGFVAQFLAFFLTFFLAYLLTFFLTRSMSRLRPGREHWARWW